MVDLFFLMLGFFFDTTVDETRASVSKYYGQELSSSEDLKTNACCTGTQTCSTVSFPPSISKPIF